MSEKHDERERRGVGRHADRRTGRLQGPDVTGRAIPPQRTPQHDTMSSPSQQAPEGARIPARAEWTEQRHGHRIAQLLLTTLVLGTLTCLVTAVVTRSPMWAIGLVLCALVAVVVRGTMIGSVHSVIRLDGSNLTVQRGSHIELFNLADSFRLVETVGTPDSPHWRLRLETAGGHVLELTPHHVDAEVLHHAVTYYRTRSEVARAGEPSWWMFRD